MVSLSHRSQGYALLAGSGLEIGALHEPAELPAGATALYLDAVDEARAAAIYPEIDRKRLVKVSFVGDVDQDALLRFPDGAFDFVVANHVLEHLANPVKAVREVFRICREGGMVVISIPDKDFTFDRGRELTPWTHLWSDYVDDTRVVADDHFEGFLRSAAPHVFTEPPENLPIHLRHVRSRREHAHVWNSESFGRFMGACTLALKFSATLRYLSTAAENQIEYFSVWQKGALSPGGSRPNPGTGRSR
jgi:SAM-dependent methyltransferase